MSITAKVIGIWIAVLAGIIVLAGSLYTVQETEQVIITQFGKPIGQPIVDAGLHFKLPFIQDVNRLEKRILPWDDEPSEMITLDRTRIIVDAFGRWRIKDATKFFLAVQDLRRAETRISTVLSSKIRNAVAERNFIEVIRTTTDRVPGIDLSGDNTSTNQSVWLPIKHGRAKIEGDIYTNAAPELEVFGIELLNVRFKRLNYNQSVRDQIYQRMISERQQIAERFRSEGAEEAAKIIGTKTRDLQQIESEAYRKIQEIEGAADAKAANIYASAYNQSPESVEFYEFVKTMETYKSALTNDTTLILSTESEFFRFLKEMGVK